MQLATNIKTMVGHNHEGAYVIVRQTADVINDDGVEAKDNMVVFHVSQIRDILSRIVDAGTCLEEHSKDDHDVPESDN